MLNLPILRRFAAGVPPSCDGASDRLIFFTYSRVPLCFFLNKM